MQLTKISLNYMKDIIKNPSNSYICSRVRNITGPWASVEVVLVYKKDVDLCKDHELFVSFLKPLYSPYDFITVREDAPIKKLGFMSVFFNSSDSDLEFGESNIDYEAIYFLRKSGVGISGLLYRFLKKDKRK